jgi:hypothetical protein
MIKELQNYRKLRPVYSSSPLRFYFQVASQYTIARPRRKAERRKKEEREKKEGRKEGREGEREGGREGGREK